MFLIQERAIEEIKQACREHPAEETGGIVVGFSRFPFITHSISSTPDADRSAASYFQNNQDVDYLNNALSQLENKGLDFKGYYHKHPGSYDELSRTDLDTAMEVLKDNFATTEGKMLMILVNELSAYDSMPKNKNIVQEDFLIRFYLVAISSKDSEEIDCREVKYKVLPDIEPMLFSFLKHANKEKAKAELKKENQVLSFWDRDWHFSKAGYGKERINTDIDEIKAMGCKVEFKSIDKNTACYEITADEKKIIMLLPREYPITPPRIVILKNNKQKEITNIELLRRWSSLFSAGDLLKKVDKGFLSKRLRDVSKKNTGGKQNESFDSEQCCGGSEEEWE